jgi:DNA-binding LytR/AlgR family response regulator
MWRASGIIRCHAVSDHHRGLIVGAAQSGRLADAARSMGQAEHDKALRVLLGEDEVLIAAEIEAMLLEIGCRVIGPVATVDEVERRAASEALEGALLDVNLRGRHVFRALPVLLRRRIPVILSSGYDDRSLYPAEFRDLPLLVKPYDRDELRGAVTEIFGSRSPT